MRERERGTQWGKSRHWSSASWLIGPSRGKVKPSVLSHAFLK